MLRVTRLLLWTFFAVLWPTTTLASPPCPSGSPSVVTGGATSPCDGYVISEGDALKIADTKLKLKDARIDLKEESAKLASCHAQNTLDADRYQADLEACDKHVSELTQILKNRAVVVETVPWTQSPWFVATITIIVTAAITIPVTWMATTQAK